MQTIQKDQDTWALPTDPYSAQPRESLRNQALSTLEVQCMWDAGYTEHQNWWDASTPLPVDARASGEVPLFNQQLAAQCGYGLAPDPRSTVGADSYNVGGDGSEEFAQAQTRCWTTAIDQLLAVDQASADPIAQTIKKQMGNLRADTSLLPLQGAAANWTECMAPLQIADLPTHPWDPGAMPPESLFERWLWDPLCPASEEEVAYAVHDAQCRESSGWTDALYEVEWEIHQSFVEEYPSELAALVSDNALLSAQYAAIIEGR